jgi:hypothetical protein
VTIRRPAGPVAARRGDWARTLARAVGTALASSLLTAALFAVSAIAAAIAATSVLTAAVAATSSARFTAITPVPPVPAPPPPRAAPGPASHGRPSPHAAERVVAFWVPHT